MRAVCVAECILCLSMRPLSVAEFHKGEDRVTQRQGAFAPTVLSSKPNPLNSEDLWQLDF